MCVCVCVCVFLFLCLLKVLSGVVRLGGEGRLAGDKIVIHIAPMPKTLVFPVFSPLCTTNCAKHVEQDTLS